jgi:cation diffusion facilitator CzcD-associated flavoprotein CzcO
VAEPDYDVAIIGAGPGGIAAAKLVRDKGITDFIISERGAEVGGDVNAKNVTRSATPCITVRRPSPRRADSAGDRR